MTGMSLMTAVLHRDITTLLSPEHAVVTFILKYDVSPQGKNFRRKLSSHSDVRIEEALGRTYVKKSETLQRGMLGLY